MKTSFGKRLREARKKQGLTVETFAQLCGTSRSYITLIETDRRLPGKKIIPKVALAIGVKTVTVLNWYLEDIGQKMKKDFKISD